jgi:tetratricopeptide (TPR) repeat protein/DNA-binding CsgD family transcriptional regulator
MSYNPFKLFAIIAILSLFACNPQREASSLLKQVQALVETQPDAALHLIDSILLPEKNLSKREYMSYLVMRVQARYKNYLPVDADTAIFVARDYFAKHNKDARQTALAYFYSGYVYREQEDFENAMVQYKQAVEYAAKTNDIDLQGSVERNIGDLLSGRDLYVQALEQYKIAERFFANSINDATGKQARCFSAIARMYRLLGQQDSALIAFDKAMSLAKINEDVGLQISLTQNLSVLYTEMEEYEKAESYLRQSFELNSDTTNLPRYYLNLAEFFSKTNQTDSLAVYVDKLNQIVNSSDDLYFRATAYHFLAANAKANDDFSAAFVYQDKEMGLVEQITRRRLEQSVYEAKQRFDYHRYKDEHTQALWKRQHLIITLLILLLSISLFAVFIYRRLLHLESRMLSLQNALTILEQTNENLQRDKQLSNENHEKSRYVFEQMIDRLQKDKLIAKENQEEISEIFKRTIKDLQQDRTVAKKNQAQLNEILRRKLDILRKSILLQSGFVNIKSIDEAKETFNEIVFGKKTPLYSEVFREIVNMIYPDLSTFIREQYPKFTDTELNVSLLSFADLETKEILNILNLKNNTLNMTRTRIRQKMGLAGRADFCVILKEMYQESINPR